MSGKKRKGMGMLYLLPKIPEGEKKMEKKNEEKTVLTEKDLENVRKAAKEGAEQGSGTSVKIVKTGRYSVLKGILVKVVSTILLVYVAMGILSAMNPFPKLFAQLGIGQSAEEHDLVLDDDGIAGYTAADFAEAVLGDNNRQAKIQVMSQKVSDVMTLTDTGLLNIKLFTKTQLITYNGTAIYTVDMSKLTQEDFIYDEGTDTFTIYIPEPELEPINIPSEEIEIADAEKGLLAFGEIKLTAEQSKKVQSEAKKKMEEKLEEENILSQAEQFAQKSIWDTYQPLITKEKKGASLKILFKE